MNSKIRCLWFIGYCVKWWTITILTPSRRRDNQFIYHFVAHSGWLTWWWWTYKWINHIISYTHNTNKIRWLGTRWSERTQRMGSKSRIINKHLLSTSFFLFDWNLLKNSWFFLYTCGIQMAINNPSTKLERWFTDIMKKMLFLFYSVTIKTHARNSVDNASISNIMSIIIKINANLAFCGNDCYQRYTRKEVCKKQESIKSLPSFQWQQNNLFVFFCCAKKCTISNFEHSIDDNRLQSIIVRSQMSRFA